LRFILALNYKGCGFDMSEKLYNSKDMQAKTRMTIEIDSPQQLRELADRFEAAERARFLPGEITIDITPSIEVRYNPSRPLISSMPLNGRTRDTFEEGLSH
jgi:hypothetical protein